MARQKGSRKTTPINLASLIRGIYGRVARRLKVDPSYVSRVARRERQSMKIEASLIRELRRIIALVEANRAAARKREARAARSKAKRRVKV
jgi:hypothetical protein